MATMSMAEKPTAVPKVRRAPSISRAPKRWPIFTVPAMPKPNAAPATRNMMMLALTVAASASSPIRRPTQIELIVPLSDWSMLLSSIGTLNNSSVRITGPSVRLPLIAGGRDAIRSPSLCPAGVAVEFDVQSFGQSQFVVQAKLCKPVFATSQRGRIRAFRHEVDAFGRHRVSGHEFKDFVNVGRFCDHELERRAGFCRPLRQPFG